MLSKKAEENTNTRICSVSLYTLKYLELQSFNRKTTITHNILRCRIRFGLVCKTTFLETAVYAADLSVHLPHRPYHRFLTPS